MARYLRRIMRIVFYGGVAILVCLLVLVGLWAVEPPLSTLMLARMVMHEPVERVWVPYEKISPLLIAAVIASEDGQFCRHAGVDWQALGEVLDNADEDGPARGASTLAMQTAKNLFLWPSRSVIRKGLEIPLALVLDAVWTKKRVLEVYLNIAEWGPGIFGAEAAAQKYFGRSAAMLDMRQASLMASALPNPILRHPDRPGTGHQRLAQKLRLRAGSIGGWLDCLR